MINRYWPVGLPRSLRYPDVAVGALLAGAARRYGERDALRDGEDVITYTGLFEQACAFAHGLRARDVGEGDVVALHMPNNRWYPVAYYGSLLAGAAVCLANPLQPPQALRSQLRDCSPVAAVTHPQAAPALAEVLPDTKLDLVVVVPPTSCAPATGPVDPGLFGPAGTTLDALLTGRSVSREGTAASGHATEPRSHRLWPTSPPDARIAPDAVAHLAYTGGTTGLSKGVRVLHRNLVSNIIQTASWRSGSVPEPDGRGGVVPRPLDLAERYPLPPGTAVALLAPPMFHAHGLMTLNYLLYCGATIVLTGRFMPETLLELAERHRATFLTGAPALWHALLDSPGIGTRDLSSVRLVVSGAAPIDGTTLARLHTTFPGAAIVEGYGLTEATCTLTSTPAARSAPRKIGSVGVPYFDTEIEIRDPARLERALPPGERGEIWARGPQITAGYLNRPEETADQFRAGWLRTGDIGYLDEDGFLYICDRIKDMLIYKGYNVYPRELEEILISHPGVAQVAVVGQSAPGVGEIPVAFVVASAVVGEAAAPPTAEALMSHVADRVVPYKRIRDVHFVEKLPTSPAGKVLKTDLRRMLVPVEPADSA